MENSQPKRKSRLSALLVVLVTVMVGTLSACVSNDVKEVKATRAPIQTVEAAPPAEAPKLRVWFVHEKDGHLEHVPVERPIEGKDILAESVKELLKGPNEKEASEGLTTEIPAGTVLLDAADSTEGVVLNLSKKFASDGGTASIETRLEQLSKTVAGAANDKKVFLDVEGKRLEEAGGEGIEVRQPINL